MAERAVDRAKKRAPFALPLLRGEPIGNTIEVFVLPAVVARHALYIGTVDHGVLITVMVGHSRSYNGVASLAYAGHPRLICRDERRGCPAQEFTLGPARGRDPSAGHDGNYA